MDEISKRPRRYLFVCTGNVCRSFMAERLLLDLARRRGLSVEARSCGLAAEFYYRVPAGTRKALEARGISCEGHSPRLVDSNLMAWADEVLAMTRPHLDYLRERFPQFTAKTFLFSSRCGAGDEDVQDPMGQADEVHEACCARLASAIESLLGGFGRGPSSGSRATTG